MLFVSSSMAGSLAEQLPRLVKILASDDKQRREQDKPSRAFGSR